MTNPVSVKQVFTRFRRWVRPRSEPGTPSAEVIQAGDFRIDLQSGRVIVRGNEVQLTQEEVDLLVFLTTHPKKIVTPSTQLVTRAGNRVRQTQFLRVLLGLCRKIEPDNSHHYIRTEPWVFYRFDPGAQL